MKQKDQRAWLFLIPALLVLSLNAFIPIITVINYSLQDILPGLPPVHVGLENFKDVLRDSNFRGALGRQVVFSAVILLIQVPLGILVALGMPKRSWTATLALVTIGLPLLIPWNVVGIIWRVFTRSDIGIVPYLFSFLNYDYNIASNPIDAYWTIVLMDVWHWTPLIALLCYSGLNAIPDAYYQAARIDGATRWRTFWVVTLPRLRSVLTIGILLRFMDSFRIFAEIKMVTGGGPGRTTAFVSDLLVNRAVGGFEFGYASALSLIYFFIIIVISYVFFLVLTHAGGRMRQEG
ncbi:MAG: sugar ABC transporter permease [Trueperaceae bacterium]|nr:sugar ABC transporter permease [Trueperaceae bacterium]